jgi:hypothetical protein
LKREEKSTADTSDVVALAGAVQMGTEKKGDGVGQCFTGKQVARMHHRMLTPLQVSERGSRKRADLSHLFKKLADAG